MTNTEKIFVKNIKMLRETKKLKMFQLANASNIDQTYYKKIEESTGTHPSLKFMNKLSVFYNIPIYEFYKSDIDINNTGYIENIEEIFGNNLIKYREKKGWTTYKAAKELEIKSQYLYKLEDGDIKAPRFEFLEKIGKVYEVEVYQLFVP